MSKLKKSNLDIFAFNGFETKEQDHLKDSDPKIDKCIDKRKILSSTSKTNDNLSCFEIYQEITDFAQRKSTNDRNEQQTFVSMALNLIQSLDEYLSSRAEQEEKYQNRLLEIVHTREILQSSLMETMTRAEEHINTFIDGIKLSNQEAAQKQHEIVDKFMENIEKLKNILPDIIQQEQMYKMEAFKSALALFQD